MYKKLLKLLTGWRQQVQLKIKSITFSGGGWFIHRRAIIFTVEFHRLLKNNSLHFAPICSTKAARRRSWRSAWRGIFQAVFKHVAWKLCQVGPWGNALFGLFHSAIALLRRKEREREKQVVSHKMWAGILAAGLRNGTEQRRLQLDVGVLFFSLSFRRSRCPTWKYWFALRA